MMSSAPQSFNTIHWLPTGGACDDGGGLATLTGATGVIPGGVCSAGSG